MINGVNFAKTINEDDIIDIEDNIKGVVALLSAMVIANDSGEHKYQKQSYESLQVSLERSIKDLDKLKKGVNYMIEHIKIPT